MPSSEGAALAACNSSFFPQVAELSNRTLVWPDLPCNTSWVGAVDPATGTFTSSSNGLWYPHGTSRSNLRCTFV